MADITNKNIQIPGVNSSTNYVQQRAYILNFNTAADITAVDTHAIVSIPAGEALTGLKVIVVEDITSSGSATVQFKLSGTAINSTAISLTNLKKGYATAFNAANIKNNIDDETANILQLTVGSAAITGGKIMVIAETIPVDSFINAG
jgi:hypothetical protein